MPIADAGTFSQTAMARELAESPKAVARLLAEHDLFEGAPGDPSDEHAVGKPVLEPGNPEPAAATLKVDVAVSQTRVVDLTVPGLERAPEPLPVPARIVGHDRNPQRHSGFLLMLPGRAAPAA